MATLNKALGRLPSPKAHSGWLDIGGYCSGLEQENFLQIHHFEMGGGSSEEAIF